MLGEKFDSHVRSRVSSDLPRKPAEAAGFLLAAVAGADAMNFSWRDQLTVHASGPIEEGDTAKFATLPELRWRKD